METPRLDPATRILLEAFWAALLGVIPPLARVLGKPNPLVNRDERRMTRRDGAGFVELS